MKSDRNKALSIYIVIAIFLLSSACLSTTNNKHPQDNDQIDNQSTINPENKNQINTEANQTQTNNNEPIQQDKPVTLTIIPINYTLEDQGDGWNVGTIELAFENQNAKTYYLEDAKNWFPGAGVNSFTSASILPNIILQTNEGPTYEVMLYSEGLGSGGRLTLPPGLRYKAYQDAYYLTWKSATAATPKRIEFKDNPDLNFDIPANQGKTVSFPYDNPPLPVLSFSTLQGVKLADDPEGVVATFTGRCGNNLYFDPDGNKNMNQGQVFLEVKAVNNDKYNEKTSSLIPYMYTTFSRTGDIRSGNIFIDKSFGSGYGFFDNITLGPGQEITGYFMVTEYYDWFKADGTSFDYDNWFYQSDSPVIVLFFGFDNPQIYNFEGCGYVPNH